MLATSIMCKHVSALRGLGAKHMAKKQCLATFWMCLPETQVIGDENTETLKLNSKYLVL